MPDPDLAVVAALLRRGRELDLLSTALTLLALGLGLFQLLTGAGWRYFGLLTISLALLGLWQKYWALRVALDAELFEQLGAAGTTLEARTRRLDQTLTALGLARAESAGRSWSQRSQGALRLLRWQALACAAQVLLVVVYLLLVPLLAVQT